MERRTKQEELIELAHKLFVYTDNRQWALLIKEVFAAEVDFDMSSAGGEVASRIPSRAICEIWTEEFKNLDQVHHQAGNFIITFKSEENQAQIFCYAIATHYKAAAKSGSTKEFVGSYDLKAILTDEGWRIHGFKHNLKFTKGNTSLNLS